MKNIQIRLIHLYIQRHIRISGSCKVILKIRIYVTVKNQN
jgi:hypothetical protein